MFQKVGKHLLLVAAIAEAFMATYGQNIFKPYISPLVFLACSIAVAFLYLRVAANGGRLTDNDRRGQMISIGSVVIFAALSTMIFFSLKKIFTEIKIEGIASSSDVIPQTMILTRRFLGGEMPYTPIQFAGYALFPTYLPLQWLPYVIAEISRIDYRWVAAVFLWLSCAFHFITTQPYKNGTVWKMIASLWPIALWYVMIKNDGHLLGITLEGLVASYYLFTANAVKRNSLVLITIGLCLTLLSRYSIILWVPCALAAIWMNRGGGVAVKMITALITAFVLIYWLPFLRHDSQVFLKGYAYHSAAALGEWTPPAGQAWPVQLYNGMGMVPWGYKLLPVADLQQRLKCYQLIHLALCLLPVAGLSRWYWKNKQRIGLTRFLLFSLKLYLTVFYAFIQIPYKYLFITPLLITGVLLADAFGAAGQTKREQPGTS